MRSNCLNESLRCALARHGETWTMVKRSEGKEGRIPHFASGAEMGALVWKEVPGGTGFWGRAGEVLYVLEYVPMDGRRKHKVTDAGSFPLYFEGEFRLRRYRLDAIGVGETFEQVVVAMLKGAVNG